MNCIYRNDHFKIITEQEVGPGFSGYKYYIENGILKVKERYIAGNIFAVHYYTDSKDHQDKITEYFKSIPDLEVMSVRSRKAYGEFWIDDIQYLDAEKDQFSDLIVRELYNSKEQLIAWECTDLSLPVDDQYYYQLSKEYYHTENGGGDRCFTSHYYSGVFSDIEYFPHGFDTDDQDVERGFVGEGAELLMIKMNIPPKMRIWYMNNDFLPEL